MSPLEPVYSNEKGLRVEFPTLKIGSWKVSAGCKKWALETKRCYVKHSVQEYNSINITTHTHEGHRAGSGQWHWNALMPNLTNLMHNNVLNI